MLRKHDGFSSKEQTKAAAFVLVANSGYLHIEETARVNIVNKALYRSFCDMYITGDPSAQQEGSSSSTSSPTKAAAPSSSDGATTSQLLKYIVHLSGPREPKTRCKLWLYLLQKNTKMLREVKGVDSDVTVTDREKEDPLYEEYIYHAYGGGIAACINKAQIGEIMRDVVRTFPLHPLFQTQGPGEAMLARVLQTVVAMRPDVGYCQGMNFVAGALLLGRIASLDMLSATTRSEDDERAGFVGDTKGCGEISKAWLSLYNNFGAEDCKHVEADVVRLMMELLRKDSKFAMGTLWSKGVPKLKLRVYQLDRLLKWTLPKLHSHFLSIQLAPEVLVAQWFITLFSYTMPISITVRLWNYIFLDGWAAVFRVALAILQSLESKFLLLNLEGVGALMRGWRNQGSSLLSSLGDIKMGASDILVMAERVKVTDDVLQQIQESYANEMISLSESVFFKASVTTNSNYAEGGLSGRRDHSDETDDDIWLSRYGELFSSEAVTDMLKLRDDINSIDVQIQIDKRLIQSKIVKVCEQYREKERAFQEIFEVHASSRDLVSRLQSEFDQLMLEAREIGGQMGLGEAPKTKSESFDDSSKETEAPPVSAAESIASDVYISPIKVVHSRSALASCGDLGISVDSGESGDKFSPFHYAIQTISKDEFEAVNSRGSSSMGGKAKPSATSFAPTPATAMDRITRGEGRELVYSKLVYSSKQRTYTTRAASASKVSSSSATEDWRNPLPSNGTSSRGSEGTSHANANTNPSADLNTLLTSPVVAIRENWEMAIKKVSDIWAGAANNIEFRSLSIRSKNCQQKIIAVHRLLQSAKQDLSLNSSRLRAAKIVLEDTHEYKESLCDQLQRLVAEANRTKGQKLSLLTDIFST